MRLFLYFVFLLISSPIFAAINEVSVFSRDGNIYFRNGDLGTKLTNTGKDRDPILSPNKELISFLRRGGNLIPKECGGLDNAKSKFGDQIWIYDIGKKKEQLLVDNDFSCSKPEKQIVDPANLQFSSDSKVLYFITSAWITSGALHVVNVDGTKQRYMIPANSFEIIKSGEYRGYLVVQQHRYFVMGGSYDWFWLFSPQGKEEGPLGEEITQAQREFLNFQPRPAN